MQEAPRRFMLATGDYGPFEGDPADRVVFGSYRATGTWSPEIVALIARLLRSGGTLIDVGANIGLVAIGTLQRCAARCIAFEPAPDNNALLCRNVARHGLRERIESRALALDDTAGEITLALCADNSGDHRLLHGAAPPGRHCVSVRATTLDEALAGRMLGRPALLKIDAQGAEARVLRGARGVLEQVDYAIVEWWPAGLLRMGDSTQALFSELGAFTHAALLDQHGPPRALRRSSELFEQLAWIPSDGSDEGFFDLLLSRSPRLP